VLERAGSTFAQLTTLRVGGPAGRLVEVESESEVCEFVSEFDRSNDPADLLVIGGGSNLVVADAGFAGTTLAIRTAGREVVDADPAGQALNIGAAAGPDPARVFVTVAAGEPWDEFVAWSLREGFSGLETLSGIPGRTGATPIQNVGAYGTELGDVLSSVRIWDRTFGKVRDLTVADCGLGYRTSHFKQRPGTVVVLAVTLRLARDDLSRRLGYPELAQRLDVEIGSRAPVGDVATAVLDLRRAKAMLLDEFDHDTWSAGSFFTNPIVPSATGAGLPSVVARWTLPDGRIKISAAGLLEAAGFGRGHGVGTSQAAVSTRHSLAVTNRGAASTSDVLALARELRDGVRSRFGIDLEPEPTLVGVAL
jgi:UDP-N-acetylmuramate dehydrogenase